jgi:hypothetical protein
LGKCKMQAECDENIISCPLIHMFLSFWFLLRSHKLWLTCSCRVVLRVRMWMTYYKKYDIWGCYSGEDVDVELQVCNTSWTLRTCRQIPAFQRNILTPSLGPLFFFFTPGIIFIYMDQWTKNIKSLLYSYCLFFSITCQLLHPS